MTESRAREELHERLERLVADMDQCIAAQNLPEPQSPLNMEIEDLYVLRTSWITTDD